MPPTERTHVPMIGTASGTRALLKQLTKTVIETALGDEMSEHLGYENHDPARAGTGNIIRNGTRDKPVCRVILRLTHRGIRRGRSNRRPSRSASGSPLNLPVRHTGLSRRRRR